MIRTAIITATLAVASTFAAGPAAAGDATLPVEVAARVAELQSHGGRFETAISAIRAEAQRSAYGWESGTPEAAVKLPYEVATRVDELRDHGDRFARAIALIEAEAARPLAFGDTANCGTAPAVVAALATDR